MKKINVLFIGAALTLASCTDEYLQKDPGSTFSDDQLGNLANTNPEALLTITEGVEAGNYFFLNDFNTANNGNIHDDFGEKSIETGLDIMSNDIVQVQNHWFGSYYAYTARNVTSLRTDMIWKFYYKVIYNMNSIITFIPDDASSEFQYIKARARAMRGFAYFNLIRLYAYGEKGIPLYTEDNLNMARVATSEIIAFAGADLQSAYDNLDGYVRPNKVAVDKNVVAGFLARYYLEYGQYALAAQYAAEAKASVSLMTDVMDGFDSIDNAEWMWGADINTETSTYYASFFSQMGNLNPGYAGLLQVYKNVDRRIFDNISATDSRKQWFVDAGNPFGLPKYANVKFVDESDFEGDYVFMRGAEMYLIEAEAKALAGDDSGARQALYDLVSTRDSGYTLSTNSGAALLNEIRFHRKLELWGEGFAFYDMKRWGAPLDRTYAGSNHASFGFLSYPANSVKFIFQIPQAEINNNLEITENNPFE